MVTYLEIWDRVLVLDPSCSRRERGYIDLGAAIAFDPSRQMGVKVPHRENGFHYGWHIRSLLLCGTVTGPGEFALLYEKLTTTNSKQD